MKELRYQGWANSVTLPELAQDLGYLGDLKLNWVGNTISGPQDIQSAATGQTDFGGAFAGVVVKLVEAGAPVKAVINTYLQKNGLSAEEIKQVQLVVVPL